MNDRRWEGQTVLVTGASKGIGRATATHFAERGARVVVHGRNATDLASLVQEIHSSGGAADPVVADLRDPESPERIVRHAAAETGSIHVLVNNAGANVFRGTLEATLEDWDEAIALDLRAVWLCAKHAAQRLPAGGSIVNVTSNHATSTLPGSFPYNVAKAGVNALTQSLAIELAPKGVRVNGIAPGYIDTPINVAYFNTFPDAASARGRAEALHPVRRLGRPAEVAQAIEFLADSKRSGFTTGTILTLDGGRSALLEDLLSTAG